MPQRNHRYMGLNIDIIQDRYDFDKYGKLVQAEPALTIIHELIHWATPLLDPVYDPVAMNGPAYDFMGPTVLMTNNIADELGLGDKKRISYNASLYEAALTSHGFNIGESYSGDNEVDIVRLGNQTRATDGSIEISDLMDHNARSDNSRDLMFGLSGDDLLKAGGGSDFVYGGQGADVIHGGAGNDFLFGDMKDLNGTREYDIEDMLFGEDGDDYLFGSGTDTLMEGGAGNDFLMGGYGNTRMYGGDGDDILVEGAGWSRIDGGEGKDTIWLDGPGASLLDSGLEDKLIWRGYHLTGGTYTIIDNEATNQNGRFEGDFYFGFLGDNGVIYSYVGNSLWISVPGTVPIFAPGWDPDDLIELEDWQPGGLGIDIDLNEMNTPWYELPESNIVDDSIWANWDSLTGRASAAANLGPIARPTPPAGVVISSPPMEPEMGLELTWEALAYRPHQPLMGEAGVIYAIA